MSNKNKEIIVSEKFLAEICDYASRSLVGKIMKRFDLMGHGKEVEDALKGEMSNEVRKVLIEVLNGERNLKKYIKELIYENYRDLAVFIKSFSEGENIGAVKFVSKKKTQG